MMIRIVFRIIWKLGYLFKFDLKDEYDHVDLFDEHQIYLGFSW